MLIVAGYLYVEPGDLAPFIAHLKAEDTVAFVTHWQGSMRGDIRKYDGSNERALADD